MRGIVEPRGSILQRNGSELVGQLETVPDPKTDAYAVFSMAMITIWSK
jgi:hypothetical protein